MLAAAVINGMGSLGSVAQELVLGRLLEDEGDLRVVLATLFGSATMSIVMLGAVFWLSRAGRTRATTSR